MILTGPQLEEYPRRWTDCLDRWAMMAPARVCLAERDGATTWRRITYAELRREALGVAARLLALDLTPEQPIAIRLPNGIDHALLAFGAMYAGLPYAPLAANAAIPEGFVSVDIASLPPARRYADVEATLSRVEADTVAKILFTSGSGEEPKRVLTTHRMLCSNQAMLGQALGPMLSGPPILCDWLPWRHVYGGNHNLGLVIALGGTLYVDDGAPTEAGLERMLANLHEVRPNVLFTVPRSLAMLLPVLGAELKAGFQVVLNGGAALSEETRMRAADLPLVGGYGSTETAPFAMFTGRRAPTGDYVGMPAPGVQLKLLPAGDHLFEACFRGPNVTPGYWRNAEMTAQTIDVDGFWHSGDALRFFDPAQPQRGLCFVTRMAEQFKLSSGTSVRVGALRRKLLEAMGPAVEDVILVGENQPELAAVLVLRPGVVLEAVRRELREWDKAETASSRQITKAWFLAAAEVPRTAKGGLMRHAVEEMLRGREPQFTL